MVPSFAFFLDTAGDEEDCDEVEMNFYEWIESSPYNGIILGVTLSTLIFTVFLSLFLRFQNVTECQPQQCGNGTGDFSVSCVSKTCRGSQTSDTARKTTPAICLNKVCDKVTVTSNTGEEPAVPLHTSNSAQGRDVKDKKRTCEKICQKLAGNYKNLMPQCKMCPRSAKKCFNFDESRQESELDRESSPMAKEGYPSATTGSSVDSLSASQRSPPSPPRVRRGSTMPIAVQTSNAFVDRAAAGLKSIGGGGVGTLKPDDGCVWKIILPKDDSFRVNITCTKLDTTSSPAPKSMDAVGSKSPLPNNAITMPAQIDDCGFKVLKSRDLNKERACVKSGHVTRPCFETQPKNEKTNEPSMCSPQITKGYHKLTSLLELDSSEFPKASTKRSVDETRHLTVPKRECDEIKSLRKATSAPFKQNKMAGVGDSNVLTPKCSKQECTRIAKCADPSGRHCAPKLRTASLVTGSSSSSWSAVDDCVEPVIRRSKTMNPPRRVDADELLRQQQHHQQQQLHNLQQRNCDFACEAVPSSSRHSPYVHNDERVMKRNKVKYQTRSAKPARQFLDERSNKILLLSKKADALCRSSSSTQPFSMVKVAGKDASVSRKRKRDIPAPTTSLSSGGGSRKEERVTLGKTSNAVQSSTSSEDSAMSVLLYQNSNKKQSDEHFRITFRPCSAARLTAQPVPTFTLHKSESRPPYCADKSCKSHAHQSGEFNAHCLPSKRDVNGNQQKAANIFECTAELREIMKVTLKDLKRYNPSLSSAQTKIARNEPHIMKNERDCRPHQDSLIFCHSNNHMSENGQASSSTSSSSGGGDENDRRSGGKTETDSDQMLRMICSETSGRAEEMSSDPSVSSSSGRKSQSLPRRSHRVDKQRTGVKCRNRLKNGLMALFEGGENSRIVSDVSLYNLFPGIDLLQHCDDVEVPSYNSRQSTDEPLKNEVHKSPGFYIREESTDFSLTIGQLLTSERLICYKGDKFNRETKTGFRRRATDMTDESYDRSANYHEDDLKDERWLIAGSQENIFVPFNRTVELVSLSKSDPNRVSVISSSETKHRTHNSESDQSDDDRVDEGGLLTNVDTLFRTYNDDVNVPRKSKTVLNAKKTTCEAVRLKDSDERTSDPDNNSNRSESYPYLSRSPSSTKYSSDSSLNAPCSSSRPVTEEGGVAKRYNCRNYQTGSSYDRACNQDTRKEFKKRSSCEEWWRSLKSKLRSTRSDVDPSAMDNSLAFNPGLKCKEGLCPIISSSGYDRSFCHLLQDKKNNCADCNQPHCNCRSHQRHGHRFHAGTDRDICHKCRDEMRTPPLGCCARHGEYILTPTHGSISSAEVFGCGISSFDQSISVQARYDKPKQKNNYGNRNPTFPKNRHDRQRRFRNKEIDRRWDEYSGYISKTNRRHSYRSSRQPYLQRYANTRLDCKRGSEHAAEKTVQSLLSRLNEICKTEHPEISKGTEEKTQQTDKDVTRKRYQRDAIDLFARCFKEICPLLCDQTCEEAVKSDVSGFLSASPESCPKLNVAGEPPWHSAQSVSLSQENECSPTDRPNYLINVDAMLGSDGGSELSGNHCSALREKVANVQKTETATSRAKLGRSSVSKAGRRYPQIIRSDLTYSESCTRYISLSETNLRKISTQERKIYSNKGGKLVNVIKSNSEVHCSYEKYQKDSPEPDALDLKQSALHKDKSFSRSDAVCSEGTSNSVHSSLDMYVMEKSQSTREVILTAKPHRKPRETNPVKNLKKSAGEKCHGDNRHAKTSIVLNAEQISYMEILPKRGKFRGLRLSEIDEPPRVKGNLNRKKTELLDDVICEEDKDVKQSANKSSSEVFYKILILPSDTDSEKPLSECDNKSRCQPSQSCATTTKKSVSKATRNNRKVKDKQAPSDIEADLARPRLEKNGPTKRSSSSAETDSKHCKRIKAGTEGCWLQSDHFRYAENTESIAKKTTKGRQNTEMLRNHDENGIKQSQALRKTREVKDLKLSNSHTDDSIQHRPPSLHVSNRHSPKNESTSSIKAAQTRRRNKKHRFCSKSDFFVQKTNVSKEQLLQLKNFISTSRGPDGGVSVKRDTLQRSVQTSLALDPPKSKADKDTLVIFPEYAKETLVKIDHVSQTEDEERPRQLEKADKHIQCPTLGSQAAIELMDLLSLIKAGKHYYSKTSFQTKNYPLDPNDRVVTSGARLEDCCLSLGKSLNVIREDSKYDSTNVGSKVTSIKVDMDGPMKGDKTAADMVGQRPGQYSSTELKQAKNITSLINSYRERADLVSHISVSEMRDGQATAANARVESPEIQGHLIEEDFYVQRKVEKGRRAKYFGSFKDDICLLAEQLHDCGATLDQRDKQTVDTDTIDRQISASHRKTDKKTPECMVEKASSLSERKNLTEAHKQDKRKSTRQKNYDSYITRNKTKETDEIDLESPRNNRIPPEPVQSRLKAFEGEVREAASAINRVRSDAAGDNVNEMACEKIEDRTSENQGGRRKRSSRTEAAAQKSVLQGNDAVEKARTKEAESRSRSDMEMPLSRTKMLADRINSDMGLKVKDKISTSEMKKEDTKHKNGIAINSCSGERQIVAKQERCKFNAQKYDDVATLEDENMKMETIHVTGQQNSHKLRSTQVIEEAQRSLNHDSLIKHVAPAEKDMENHINSLKPIPPTAKVIKKTHSSKRVIPVEVNTGFNPPIQQPLQSKNQSTDVSQEHTNKKQLCIQQNAKRDKEIKIQINLNMTGPRKGNNDDAREPTTKDEVVGRRPRDSSRGSKNCRLPVLQRHRLADKQNKSDKIVSGASFEKRHGNVCSDCDHTNDRGKCNQGMESDLVDEHERLRVQDHKRAQEHERAHIYKRVHEHVRKLGHLRTKEHVNRKEPVGVHEHVREHHAREKEHKQDAGRKPGTQDTQPHAGTNMKDKQVMTQPSSNNRKKTDIYNTLLSALLLALKTPGETERRSDENKKSHAPRHTKDDKNMGDERPLFDGHTKQRHDPREHKSCLPRHRPNQNGDEIIRKMVSHPSDKWSPREKDELFIATTTHLSGGSQRRSRIPVLRSGTKSATTGADKSKTETKQSSSMPRTRRPGIPDVLPLRHNIYSTSRKTAVTRNDAVLTARDNKRKAFGGQTDSNVDSSKVNSSIRKQTDSETSRRRPGRRPRGLNDRLPGINSSDNGHMSRVPGRMKLKSSGARGVVLDRSNKEGGAFDAVRRGLQRDGRDGHPDPVVSTPPMSVSAEEKQPKAADEREQPGQTADKKFNFLIPVSGRGSERSGRLQIEIIPKNNKIMASRFDSHHLVEKYRNRISGYNSSVDPSVEERNREQVMMSPSDLVSSKQLRRNNEKIRDVLLSNAKAKRASTYADNATPYPKVRSNKLLRQSLLARASSRAGKSAAHKKLNLSDRVKSASASAMPVLSTDDQKSLPQRNPPLVPSVRVRRGNERSPPPSPVARGVVGVGSGSGESPVNRHVRRNNFLFSTASSPPSKPQFSPRGDRSEDASRSLGDFHLDTSYDVSASIVFEHAVNQPPGTGRSLTRGGQRSQMRRKIGRTNGQ